MVVGFGVNLATSPAIAGRPVADLGGTMAPEAFAPLLAGSMSRILDLWRSSAQTDFVRAWLSRAHPVGTQMKVHGADSEVVNGRFDGLDPDGTLRLRLEDGSVRAIHAADVTIG